MTHPIRSILIANRGEIAARIIRTAQDSGYRTIAVFSEADRNAPHVTLADHAVALGAGDATTTYLDQAKLIAAAHATGADAIHPGYGFLAEHAGFAQACVDANIRFIGPDPATIALMGDKARAKAHVAAYGVPIIPGYDGADQSDDALTTNANRLGTPLLIKAVAGGGGRGMRIITDLSQLPDALTAARREAMTSFGDDRLMLEKFIDSGRHIEVQICGDHAGTILHLGDRDCTAQRRRQKIIEEAPASSLSPERRTALHHAAVQAAASVNYRSLGTVEFILDDQDQFYFLEMNTRIQVEHTITEAITGIDLVDWQLRIANGEPLPCDQSAINFTGHAIEARLCAEDPDHQFAPQTGTIDLWRPSTNLPGIRIDSGIIEGAEITPYYDSMLAKFIAHGRTRPEAIRRLQTALTRSPILGITTNANFLIDLLASPSFQTNSLRTATLDHWRPDPIAHPSQIQNHPCCLAAALFAGLDQHGLITRPPTPLEFALRSGNTDHHCQISLVNRQWQIAIDQAPAIVVDHITVENHTLRYQLDGISGTATILRTDTTLTLALNARIQSFTEFAPAQQSRKAGRDPTIRAPLSGRLLLCAEPDTILAPNQRLAVIEAMKMETIIALPVGCRILSRTQTPGAQIAMGDVLVTVAYPAEPEPSHG